MRRITQVIIYTFLFFISCSTNALLVENLILKEGRYRAEGSSLKPYTGIAIRKFESGELSFKVNLYNGIPDGQWTSFGYHGEVIQSGRFTPHLLKNHHIDSIRRILRVNICTINEGNERFIEIFVITDDYEASEIKKDSALFKTLLDEIKSSEIDFDCELVEKIRIVKSEL